MMCLRGLHKAQEEADASPDAWERKSVCGEIRTIRQSLSRMSLLSYGLEKAQSR